MKVRFHNFRAEEPAKPRRGFTLIELLVVISIIGLLASVVMASVNGVRSKGRWARMVSDFNQIGKAAELFVANENLYPCDAPPGYDGASTPAAGTWRLPESSE